MKSVDLIGEIHKDIKVLIERNSFVDLQLNLINCSDLLTVGNMFTQKLLPCMPSTLLNPTHFYEAIYNCLLIFDANTEMIH